MAGELLSPASTDYLCTVLRSTSAFTDGVRLRLTTPERLRVATKAGWFDAGRDEAGVVFTADGAPGAVYSLFATGPFAGDAAVDDTDFGANHPALKARQVLGRALFDAVEAQAGAQAVPAAGRVRATPEYHPSNGG